MSDLTTRIKTIAEDVFDQYPGQSVEDDLSAIENGTKNLWLDIVRLGDRLAEKERKLAEAREKVTAIRETCHWRENENGAWWSDCKRGYEFTTDGPAANEFAWCPFCGKQCVPILLEHAARIEAEGGGRNG